MIKGAEVSERIIGKIIVLGTSLKAKARATNMRIRGMITTEKTIRFFL